MEVLIGFLDGLRPSRKLQRIWLPKRIHEPQIPGKFLTVVAIARDEARYLPEWIVYHTIQGVEHFYIYDNGSRDNTQDVLAPFVSQGLVTLIRWPNFIRGWEGVVGPNGRMQRLAFAHALTSWGQSSHWMAFIDIDEFIVPHGNRSIPEFLSDYEDLPTVCAWWKMFASEQDNLLSDGLVTELITTAASPGAAAPHKFQRFKSFVKPARVAGVMSTHTFIFDDNLAYGINEQRQRIPYFRDSQPSYYSTDQIQINHYYYRSSADAAKRQARGRSLHNRVVPENFVQHIRAHAVSDTSAVSFAPKIREKLEAFQCPPPTPIYLESQGN